LLVAFSQIFVNLELKVRENLHLAWIFLTVQMDTRTSNRGIDVVLRHEFLWPFDFLVSLNLSSCIFLCAGLPASYSNSLEDF